VCREARLVRAELARIVHTRFLLRSLGEFEGSGCHLRRQTLGPLGLSGLISVAEQAPVVFLALMMRAREQDPALA
jgi:hypothetical protein